MSIGIIIKNIVTSNTLNDRVNVRQVALDFGCRFGESFLDATQKGRLAPVEDDAGTLAEITFNAKNTEAENNTIIALLLAKALLTMGGGTLKAEVCDSFFLADMRQYRMSPQMMLATRLAIPESVIARVDDLNFRSSRYAFDNNLMPNFVNSAFYISEGTGLFGVLRTLTVSTGAGDPKGIPAATVQRFGKTPPSTSPATPATT